MINVPKIIPVWKKVGESTHVIAHQIAQKYGVLTSHTGTLDPMAEGVVIILTGEERLKKYEYAHWLKTYEFTMIFGIDTDSYDGLGFPTLCSTTPFARTQLEEVLKSFNGSYTQTVPPYAAIKVKGKPLHWYARNNLLNTIELPTRSGDLSNIKLLDFYELELSKITHRVLNNIASVVGDLRQEEVSNAWAKLSTVYKNFYAAQITVTTTKGLYVRGLAVDIAKRLCTYGFVLELIRTKNGDYTFAE
ncbi:hypothetical protein KC980_03685 [candidate division WWE3 bacterium]|uniref:tRNA pseudouridine(55) synthase n=1 Tax=candidate division WWE3 bacterium TaxID=2053526 RepID=A0A955EC26_UNCKA|nr:hypothetical protein [candidate division WWE3 bacterium]